MTCDAKQNARYQGCGICSQLAGYERGLQVAGREEQGTFVPAAADSLKIRRDLKRRGCRVMQIQQCPECETYYLYKTDYEYLAFGSAGEQILTRLTDEAAAEYFDWPEVK